MTCEHEVSVCLHMAIECRPSVWTHNGTRKYLIWFYLFCTLTAYSFQFPLLPYPVSFPSYCTCKRYYQYPTPPTLTHSHTHTLTDATIRWSNMLFVLLHSILKLSYSFEVRSGTLFTVLDQNLIFVKPCFKFYLVGNVLMFVRGTKRLWVRVTVILNRPVRYF